MSTMLAAPMPPPALPKLFVRGYAALLGLGAAVPLVVALAVSPDDLEAGRVVLSPPCPIKAKTGHDCPSCGMTRGVAALGHGEWARALAYNRASPVVLAVCALVVVGACALLVRRA